MLTVEKIAAFKKGLMIDYGLSESEAIALWKYKGQHAKYLNSKIRAENLNDEDLIFQNDLVNALTKIPISHEKTIYRHLQFTKSQLKNACIFFQNTHQQELCFPEFISCSLRSCFSGNDDYNFVIEIETSTNSNAKDIFALWGKYNLHDTEEEILFLNNSCFKNIYNEDEKKVKLKEISTNLEIIKVPLFKL